MYKTEIEQIGDEFYFVSASPAARRLRTQAALLAQTDVPVLITGEAGSGKATTAHLIHSLSIRSSFAFVQVSCATLTADLLEGELFGHDRGVGNGLLETKLGKVEQCATGTILLEDLEAMPISLQSRLLSFLQSREFVRNGGSSPIRADARIIATAQAGDNLEQAVAEKRVSEELYYHLSAFQLHVPSLRERREEIPLLLGHFVNRLSRRYGVPAPRLSLALCEACQNYTWPGNLHELEIFVKRFLVFGDEEAAVQELLSHSRREAANGHAKGSTGAPTSPENQPLDEKAPSLKTLVRNAKGEAERIAIAHALEETHWNRKAAARLLSISYRALLYKIQEYRIVPSSDSELLYSYTVKEAK